MVNGNDAFLRLERTGMSLADIDATLRQKAGNGPHPSERRVQIKYIMRHCEARQPEWPPRVAQARSTRASVCLPRRRIPQIVVTIHVGRNDP